MAVSDADNKSEYSYMRKMPGGTATESESVMYRAGGADAMSEGTVMTMMMRQDSAVSSTGEMIRGSIVGDDDEDMKLVENVNKTVDV